MQPPGFNVNKLTKLRLEAEMRLKQGTAPKSRGWTLNSDTLALLFKLASDPVQADDALKLLHELQTYQVELDMQHEQLESNEYELVHALSYYNTLFNYAPVGYFVVSHDDRIVEGNLAGARLLGVPQDELVNSLVHSFFAPASRTTITAMLKKVREDRAGTSWAVQTASSENVPRLLRITADISPEGDSILLVVSV